MITEQTYSVAGFWGRLGALIYDSLLLIAWLMLATFLYLFCSGKSTVPPENFLFQSYLILASFIFFFLFWSVKKQTLGMRAWHLTLHSLDGKKIYGWQLVVRFVVAIFSFLFFGLGFFWMLLDKNNLTWHDKFSKTQLLKNLF